MVIVSNGHSTLAADNGQSSILLCLDFTTAFHIVEHSLLLNVLEKSFGVTGSCLSWFDSYLSSRSSCVSIESSQFLAVSFHFGVPQGSILGPLLYILYTFLRSSLHFLLIANCMLMILIFTLPTLILL